MTKQDIRFTGVLDLMLTFKGNQTIILNGNIVLKSNDFSSDFIL